MASEWKPQVRALYIKDWHHPDRGFEPSDKNGRALRKPPDYFRGRVHCGATRARIREQHGGPAMLQAIGLFDLLVQLSANQAVHQRGWLLDRFGHPLATPEAVLHQLGLEHEAVAGAALNLLIEHGWLIWAEYPTGSNGHAAAENANAPEMFPKCEHNGNKVGTACEPGGNVTFTSCSLAGQRQRQGTGKVQAGYATPTTGERETQIRDTAAAALSNSGVTATASAQGLDNQRASTNAIPAVPASAADADGSADQEAAEDATAGHGRSDRPPLSESDERLATRLLVMLGFRLDQARRFVRRERAPPEMVREYTAWAECLRSQGKLKSGEAAYVRKAIEGDYTHAPEGFERWRVGRRRAEFARGKRSED